MKQNLTISLCQFPVSFLDYEKSCADARLYVAQAAAENSHLVCFPEMTLTGISNKERERMADASGRTVRFFQELAIEHGIAIGFGWGKPHSDLPDSKLENHYTVVDADGSILSDYVKIHPFSYSGENEHFVRGNSFKSFSFHGFAVTTFICYDMRFPEIFQAASKNSDLILVAANWPEGRSMHWKVLSQARAIENQVYLGVCNCCGDVGGLYYSGDTSLYNPNGDLLGRISDKEGLLTCVITNDVVRYREEFPVKEDRLVEYYKEIL